nr:hypothetical protein [Tanacetum cinerariifolium]
RLIETTVSGDDSIIGMMVYVEDD